MAKSRDFSIYLLKIGFDPSNVLVDNHGLTLVSRDGTSLPEGALMYVSSRPPSPPWWKNYWGIANDMFQSLNGAIVFLSVNERWIALTFGQTRSKLYDIAYEYDFGLRTALNAINPDEIKSTDIFQPENAKRQRIQSPRASNINYFDIQYDETILKRLTGAVRPEFADIIKHVTGSESLKLTTKVQASEILDLCDRIVQLYEREDFQTHFPEIMNITPVRDPEKLAHL